MKTIEMLKIERESETGKETVAFVPFRSGIYPTAQGDLSMEVFKPDLQGQQKVVFRGDAIPTIKQRGKRGQFRDNSGKRRVVDFSPRPKDISQDVGADSRLIFRKESIREAGSFAAD